MARAKRVVFVLIVTVSMISVAKIIKKGKSEK
jgi:hypothetical protein